MNQRRNYLFGLNRNLLTPNPSLKRVQVWGTFSLLIIGISFIPPVSAQVENRSSTLPKIETRVEINRPVLQIGSRGGDVSELQATLKLLGYYNGAVNGIYSEQTATAVSAFQKAAGLTPDGITNSATWNRLFPPVTAINPPTPASTVVCEQPVTSVASAPPKEPQNPSFPVLQVGMRGIAVQGLQERLKAKGFLKDNVDGIFGPATLAAVKAAQTEYKLKADGVVGPDTWIVLLK